VEIETGRDPRAAVIWLHGLGADGHDFEPIVPDLVQPGERPMRFVFPHAPIRPVTLNGGYAMRAWYDIVALDRRSAEDENGIRASQAAIESLIRRENARGVPTGRIVLAGFSQGGALALFTGTRYGEPLAGIIGLSCYQLLRRASTPSAAPPTRRLRYSSPTARRIRSCCRCWARRPAGSFAQRVTRSNGMRTACLTPCVRKKSVTSPPGYGAYWVDWKNGLRPFFGHQLR